jgi:hypothetical protein
VNRAGRGGEHRGAADMITGVWALIASVYEMHVDPLDYLQVDDERVLVLGRYWGQARDGGSAVDAAFAHIITARGDRIAALQQITDTASGASSRRPDARTDQHRIRARDR